MKYILMIFIMLIPSNLIAQERKAKPGMLGDAPREPIFEKPVKTSKKSNTVSQSEVIVSLSNRLAVLEKELHAQKAVVVKPTYTLNPIIHSDGFFHSSRFIDYDKKAGELYQVSGAAINAYTYQSMKYRNDLERKLDLDWTNMKIRHNFMLKPIPWKSK